MKFTLLLITLALLVMNAPAQPAKVDGKKNNVLGPADSSMIEKIKTPKGMLVISNEAGNYFSFEIKGKEISSLPGGLMRFSVDGKYLEMMQHDKTPFVKETDKISLTELEILELHRKWYSDQIEKTFGAKLQVETIPLKIMMEKDVLKWSFPMPPEAGYKHLKRQAYISIVKGDQILMLNSAWTTEIVEYKEISQLLWDTLTTLKVSDKPIRN